MKAFTVLDVSKTTLNTLLTETASHWQWFYGEQKEGIELLRFSEVLPSWSQWTHGRAFDTERELSWWREDNGGYQLQLLTEKAPPTTTIAWGNPTIWKPVGSYYNTLLHGELDNERSKEQGIATWSEGRIPRWLMYPLDIHPDDAPQRVVLTTQTYAQNGIVGLTRLIRVKPQLRERDHG